MTGMLICLKECLISVHISSYPNDTGRSVWLICLVIKHICVLEIRTSQHNNKKGKEKELIIFLSEHNLKFNPCQLTSVY